MSVLTPEKDFYIDKKTHEYYLHRQNIPGLTKILSRLGIIHSEYYTEASARRGQDIHLICEINDRVKPGYTDNVFIPDMFLGYKKSWDIFNQEFECVWEFIEEAIWHPIFLFACTPDRVGLVKGNKSVVEIKSGGKQAWHRLQTSAQASCHTGIKARYAVYLDPKGGRPFVDAHRNPQDYSIFQACLTAYNFK